MLHHQAAKEGYGVATFVILRAFTGNFLNTNLWRSFGFAYSCLVNVRRGWKSVPEHVLYKPRSTAGIPQPAWALLRMSSLAKGTWDCLPFRVKREDP